MVSNWIWGHSGLFKVQTEKFSFPTPLSVPCFYINYEFFRPITSLLSYICFSRWTVFVNPFICTHSVIHERPASAVMEKNYYNSEFLPCCSNFHIFMGFPSSTWFLIFFFFFLLYAILQSNLPNPTTSGIIYLQLNPKCPSPGLPLKCWCLQGSSDISFCTLTSMLTVSGVIYTVTPKVHIFHSVSGL